MKNLWIDHIGSTFMEVNWKLDCSDRIGNPTGFKIFYCPIISPIEPVCKEKEKEQTVMGAMDYGQGNVTGLRPYTTYMLTVSVITKHKGSSLQSDRLYNTTLEAVPDTPPLNVDVRNVTNSTMVVVWSPPLAMNGVLRYYLIEYRNVSEGRIYEKKIDPPRGNSTGIVYQALIDDLMSYTDYDVEVRACTVDCSHPSESVRKRTAVSQPGIMVAPVVRFLNMSLLNVTWTTPTFKGGKLDMYELSIKERTSSGNSSRHVNTTDRWSLVPNCNEDVESAKIYYFSVRAINVDGNRRYPGKWSAEAEHYCPSSSRFIYWVLSSLAVTGAIFILVFFFAKKLYEHCQMMSDVEVKLPSGLDCGVPQELDQWPSNPKMQNDDMHRRDTLSADEELLLDRKNDVNDSVMGISGDSSGCSSGQESVISSVSGTNLSTDSGTEQPKINDNVSPEKTLRCRKPGSDTSWNSEISWQNKQGYVTMPSLDKSGLASQGWPVPGKKNSGNGNNYCVLGVNSAHSPSALSRIPRVPSPSTVATILPDDMDMDNTGYAPMSKNINTDYTKEGYVKTVPFACDSEMRKPDVNTTQSPYVIAVNPSTLAAREYEHTFHIFKINFTIFFY